MRNFATGRMHCAEGISRHLSRERNIRTLREVSRSDRQLRLKHSRKVEHLRPIDDNPGKRSLTALILSTFVNSHLRNDSAAKGAGFLVSLLYEKCCATWCQNVAMAVAIAVMISPAGAQPEADSDTPGESEKSVVAAPKKLLDSNAFPGREWVFFSGKKDAKIGDTWTIEQSSDGPVLICRGEPHGYIRTTKPHEDFEFGLEWKYPSDENGNSGVLLYTDQEDRIWPTAVQVQLHTHKTGSIVVSGSAKLENEIRTKNGLSRPVNLWNELVITSRNGKMNLKINGKDVGTVVVLAPTGGRIGLQSEGSEVHFRKIWLRDLSAKTARSDPDDTCECFPESMSFYPTPEAFHTYPQTTHRSKKTKGYSQSRQRDRYSQRMQSTIVVPDHDSVIWYESEVLIEDDPSTRRGSRRNNVADRNSLADGNHLSGTRGSLVWDYRQQTTFASSHAVRHRHSAGRRRVRRR